ncbi:alpha/beta fold hydrolase [Bacillus sp. A301a_S52]|nr:alpha/beta fold hydrolase [Bacillus sp. A301a_S52]
MIGCLIVHGFVGAPDETAEIENHFRDKNWLVYCPELPGHDGTKEALKSVSYKHWVYKAEVAMKELLNRCEKVYVIGFSMGGVIASYLAAKYPVEKLVLISSAVYYLNMKQLMHDMKGWFIESIRGDLAEDDIYQFYKAKIQRLPMAATLEFVKMVKRLRPHVDEITAPTLVIQGKNDGLVPEKSAEYIYDHIQSEEKELFYFPEAKHYIWFGEEKEELLEMIDGFFIK